MTAANHDFGRPLGTMVAWLNADFAKTFERGEHNESLAVALLSKEARLAARAELSDVIGGRDLLSYERPQREGEDVEPELPDCSFGTAAI